MSSSPLLCSARVLTNVTLFLIRYRRTHTQLSPDTASRKPKTARPRACLPRVYRPVYAQRTPSTSVSASHV